VITWRIFHHEHLPKIKFGNLIYSFLGIFLFNIGNIAYFIALEKGFASIVVPLSNTYITITVILSLIYLKEKITRIQLLGIISVIIGVVLVSLTNNTMSKPSESQNQSSIPETVSTPTVIRESVVITHVLDGDTIETAGGKRVRLIGIDTPELNTDIDSSQCFASESAKITQQLLENQTVELEKDNEDIDKYGRLLRYVYSDGVFINEFLLRQGYGRTMSIPPNIKYAKEFEAAEKEAREDRRGLWKNCN
jgi:micrococcal nuclease